MPEQGLPEQGLPEQALSEHSLTEWRAFAESLGAEGTASLAQERLNQFLIGVHRRGENLYAHELKTLLDDGGLRPDVAQDLMSFVAPALVLLADYDLALAAEAEGDDDDEQFLVDDDEFDVEEGVLVI